MRTDYCRFPCLLTLAFLPVALVAYPLEFYEAFFKAEELLARGSNREAFTLYQQALAISGDEIERSDSRYDTKGHSERYSKWHAGELRVSDVNCDEGGIALYQGFYRLGFLAYRIIYAGYYLDLNLDELNREVGLARSGSSPYGKGLLKILMARFYFRDGHFDRARELAEEALVNIRSYDDIENKHEALYLICYGNYSHKNFEAALAVLENVLKSGKGNSRARAKLHKLKGLIYADQGRFSEAAQSLEKCLEILSPRLSKIERLGQGQRDPTNAVIPLGIMFSLAVPWTAPIWILAERENRTDLIFDSREELVMDNPWYERVDALYTLARINIEAGRILIGLEQLSSAQSVFLENGVPSMAAEVGLDVVGTFIEFGDVGSAVQNIQKIMEYLPADKLGRMLYYKALVYEKQGNYVNAAEAILQSVDHLDCEYALEFSQYRLALRIVRQGNISNLKLQSLIDSFGEVTTEQLAQLMVDYYLSGARGEPPMGMDGETLIASFGGELAEIRDWKMAYATGKALLESGDIHRSISFFERGFYLVESTRREIVLSEVKENYILSTMPLIEQLVRCYILIGDYDKAFHAAELGRARSFLDRTVTKVAFDEMEKLFNIRLAGVIDLSSDADIKTSTKSDLRTLSEVQELLNTDDLLLAYYFVGSDLAIFLVSSDSIEVELRINCRDAIEGLVEELRASCQIPGDPDWFNISHQLSGWLLPESQGILSEKTELIILPHRMLHLCPFSCLFFQSELLVTQFKIRFIAHTSVSQSSTQEHSKKVLVIADPKSDPVLGLPSLQGARAEGATIASLASEAGYTVDLVAGKDATEAKFKSSARGDYAIVHLACHGVFSPDTVSSSFLALGRDLFDDGQLTIDEWPDFQKNPQIVFLSACETAVHKFSRSDELQGFTRKILEKGTPNVVGTLWSVPDAAFQELVEGFYSHFFSINDDVSSTLNVSILNSMHNVTYDSQSRGIEVLKSQSNPLDLPHPFYWASVQLFTSL